MDKLELSIIIVDYKSADFTIDLISDLKKHLSNLTPASPAGGYEVRVVDNNPQGNAAKKIKKAHPDARNLKIIKAKKNLGFAAGNNLAAKEAGGEYLLLLNPDIHLVDNSIEKMLDFVSKQAEIGALTCLLYQKDAKNLQRHFFGNFQSLATVLLRRQAGLPAEALAKAGKMPATHDESFYCDMVTGAALMVRRKLFEEIGGFDENFFMYIEDEDFCRRLQNLGYKNAVLTTARLIHYEGQSSTSFEKKQFYYKSQDYYWQKHYGRFKTALMKIIRAPYVWYQKMKNGARE